jgi:glycosyltransferase involved in cell wall biosynthesis
MKILVQTIYFTPRLGGVESHVHSLCRGLAARGHKVTVVTSRADEGGAPRERLDGIDVRRVWCPTKSLLGWLVNAVLTVPAFLARARDADLYHAHTVQSALGPMIARALFRRPLVVTFHTSHELRMASKPRWRPVLRMILGAADAVPSTSVELDEAVASLSVRVPHFAIVNGVDTDFFRPVAPRLPREPDTSVLLAVRRLVPKNGLRYLLEAMPALLARRRAVCYLIGEGPLEAELKALARSLGVESAVRFLGGIANAELPPYFASADVVVVPSLVEATSIAALEAMACARPVAASRVGGLPEIIDETVGTLFESANPADLAERVAALLARPDRDALGARGRERVLERASLAALVATHERLYEDLLARRGRRSEAPR